MLWAAIGDGPPDLTGLFQYGAIGILLAAFVAFAFMAWKRETQRSDRLETENLRLSREMETANRESQRADRLEAEVGRLNGYIQTEVVPLLTTTTAAVTEYAGLLRIDRRREYERAARRDGDAG